MELTRIKKPKLSVDLAPLIDVVFQLLVFFMLTSTFANPAMKLVLPKAKSAEQVESDRIIVSIDTKANVMINGEKTSFENFTEDLEKVLANQNKTTIDIRGDKEMPYRHFVEVMDKAKQAGAQQINIVHEVRE